MARSTAPQVIELSREAAGLGVETAISASRIFSVSSVGAISSAMLCVSAIEMPTEPPGRSCAKSD
jgi:hypothetical protein